MLWSGEWARGSRAQVGLERGGESPEGALGPRARRRIARGVSRPVGWWVVMVSLGRGPSCFGLRPRGACFVGFMECSFAFIIFRKRGVFPGY
jgi:hypothetical protein